ncbi:hypothetical protein O5O51_10570 [Sinirhodobacter sp. HNIBRBA609]|nr:hypothetical protein O5O51_10570 [Sinirhodobacter sp. HNIBRBA609]
MSDLQRITDLEAQRQELQTLIEESRDDDDIVGQLSFAARLGAVEDEIASLQAVDAKVAEIALLFDGGPVDGKRSIDANFAAQALHHFQSIVTRLFSANLRGELASRGKIRGADLAALNIRGVATGSFGFILEEKDALQFNALKTPIREALEEAASLFDEFTQESDDEFLIDVDDINPRVFKALAQFFGHLEKNDASLKTNLPDRQLSFDRASISRAYKRITETKVKIDSVTWVGTLVGLSPIRRTFDFKQDGTQEIISGKFSHQVSQDYLERIEGEEGITLGDKFIAKIEIGTIRKPDGSISTSYTVTDLVQAENDYGA